MDESIKLLQNSGVKVCMITGDGQATATAIATMLGIQSQAGEKIVLSGAEVDTMSDVELQNVADKVINFFLLFLHISRSQYFFFQFECLLF